MYLLCYLLDPSLGRFFEDADVISDQALFDQKIADHSEDVYTYETVSEETPFWNITDAYAVSW